MRFQRVSGQFVRWSISVYSPMTSALTSPPRLIISDCAFGGEIDTLLEVSAKVNAIPVKEPEISSSTLI